MVYSQWLQDGGILPLAVDFDGTMHDGDLNVLGFKWLGWRRWGVIFRLMVVWMVWGKAAMKLRFEELALAEGWQPELVWQPVMLDMMAAAAKQGRPVLVVTGSAQRLVEAIIRRKGLPYDVVGTVDVRINLVAEAKAKALVARFGKNSFDYAGNSRDDLKVWAVARGAVAVGVSACVRRALLRMVPLERVLFLTW